MRWKSHAPYELPEVHYTVVRVSKQQMGVGGDDSWEQKLIRNTFWIRARR